MKIAPRKKIISINKPLLRYILSLVLLPAIFFSLYAVNVSGVMAASATMFLTPTASSYSVGKTFSVSVKVNTGGSSINAAQGKISFDTGKLSLVSISKSGSVFSLWTTDPLETSGGTIEFGGGIPTPGFTGSSGTIFTISFRAREAGDTTVSFISGAVLANDGKGTNILSTLGGGKYSLNPTSFIPRVQAPVETAPGTLSAPRIISSTHPDPDSWYPRSTAKFEWAVSNEVEAVRLLIGKLSTVSPTVLYEPPIDKKTIEDLEDGIWYFHARFRNKNGWGQVTHFPVKVDTTPPKQFEITVDNKGDKTNPSPLFSFRAVDATSGIREYQIQIDNNTELLTVTPNMLRSGTYKMPPLGPGEHIILIKAIDKAGNLTPATTNVTIKGIEVPTITEYPERIGQGNQLIVKGTSLPNVKVIISIGKKGDLEQVGSVVAEDDGTWRYPHVGDLERGNYSMYAIAEDSRGAQSEPSPSVSFSVSPPLFLKFGKVAIDYLTTMITLIVLVAVFVGAIFYGWYAITQWRKRLRKEVGEAEDSVTLAFRELYDDIQEQFEALEETRSKRSLTKEEKKILKSMKANMKVAEKFIKKEIRDVKKEVN